MAAHAGQPARLHVTDQHLSYLASATTHALDAYADALESAGGEMTVAMWQDATEHLAEQRDLLMHMEHVLSTHYAE